MAGKVLEAQAFLTFLRGDPGAELVRDLLDRASQRNTPIFMIETDLAEVKYTICRSGGSSAWKEIKAELPALPIDFHPFDRAIAEIAADMAQRYSITVVQAAAPALATFRKAELVTANHDLRQLDKDMRITWIRG